MGYTEKDAASYRIIGLDGSYGISLLPALAEMGDLSGKTVLDFGCGTGRTARALRDHGAQRVLAVDKDPNMLRAAGTQPGIEFIKTGPVLQFGASTIDAAFCANVFPEFSKLSDILWSCNQIAGVLVEGATFVVVVPNPDSIDCDYVSYRYIDVRNPISGTPMTCLIKGPEPMYLQDYYWTQDDYTGVLTNAGFDVISVSRPRAAPGSGAWLDETAIAPDLVIKCTRAPSQLNAA